ncbi:hypothetical protein [Hymenobacter coalescens]
MSRTRDILRNWFVKRGRVSLSNERIQFVQACLAKKAPLMAASTVYLLATGVTPTELSTYLPAADVARLNAKAYLSAFGAIDQLGNKYFFTKTGLPITALNAPVCTS